VDRFAWQPCVAASVPREIDIFVGPRRVPGLLIQVPLPGVRWLREQPSVDRFEEPPRLRRVCFGTTGPERYDENTGRRRISR
jgi:hypothetical protein